MMLPDKVLVGALICKSHFLVFRCRCRVSYIVWIEVRFPAGAVGSCVILTSVDQC